MSHRQDLGLGHRHSGGGARPGIEQGQLAEHLPGPEHGDQGFTPVGGRVAELDLAGLDEEELVAGLALGEQDVALGQAHLNHRRPHRGGGIVVEGSEQWRGAQPVLHG